MVSFCPCPLAKVQAVYEQLSTVFFDCTIRALTSLLFRTILFFETLLK